MFDGWYVGCIIALDLSQQKRNCAHVKIRLENLQQISTSNCNNLKRNCRGTLFILSGPSGVGKNTVAERLLETVGDENLRRVITVTTRPPRSFEKNGIDYHFISRSQFLEKIERSEFLEYARVHGDNYYGSPRADVQETIEKSIDALLVIDTAGVAQILQLKNDFRTVTIFIAPKSLDELRRRIIGRGTEETIDIAKRMQTAENEIKQSAMYDYVIISSSRDDDFSALLDIYANETGKFRSAQWSKCV
ncbi:MAG: guanylate kinase [Puniceicoccales bacterium]|nr:guanylate kinase [Puniceicoccales bacterium]